MGKMFQTEELSDFPDNEVNLIFNEKNIFPVCYLQK